MTNDMPPRACLADFGFTTVVPDPQNQISWSPVLEGGVPVFMAPELLAPYKFGRSDLSPTQEGDVYAFGLTIIQVMVLCCRCLLVFLDIPSGPYRRLSISKHQTSGALVPHRMWRPPR